MAEVFRHEEEILEVRADWLDRLKRAAAESPLHRARLCLHLSTDDTVQEMLIAICRNLLFQPHRHLRKTESFHIIEGDLYVLIFDDRGEVIRAIHMGPPGSGRVFCYRLNASRYHAILPRSPFVVFHETTAGPFRTNEAQFAPWAPADEDALRDFLEGKLTAELRKTGL